jgi:hypothetical protein
MIDSTCKCGHFLNFHGDPFNGTKIEQCWHYNKTSRLTDGSIGFDYDCLCCKYERDNLKYLEECYEKQNLG